MEEIEKKKKSANYSLYVVEKTTFERLSAVYPPSQIRTLPVIQEYREVVQLIHISEVTQGVLSFYMTFCASRAGTWLRAVPIIVDVYIPHLTLRHFPRSLIPKLDLWQIDYQRPTHSSSSVATPAPVRCPSDLTNHLLGKLNSFALKITCSGHCQSCMWTHRKRGRLRSSTRRRFRDDPWDPWAPRAPRESSHSTLLSARQGRGHG
ncbi:Protein of unknown function [Pyronema omphalodes CBS 100304]|uniref:Uncharacterized protein n=1 Tax=Pyronema omphalodes (strain CBS 100304) TaxID=1076935 RepID=U4LQT4_PYROM|nr:Protein of unknown function [Pyronema omphalodes CBS 100304]